MADCLAVSYYLVNLLDLLFGLWYCGCLLGSICVAGWGVLWSVFAFGDGWCWFDVGLLLLKCLNWLLVGLFSGSLVRWGGVGVVHCCVLVFCFVFLVDVLLRL